MAGPRPSDFDLIAKEAIAELIPKKKPSADEIEVALKAHQFRSARARAIDESMTKNKTNILEEWLRDPARFDFEGVDTAKPKKKRRSKK